MTRLNKNRPETSPFTHPGQEAGRGNFWGNGNSWWFAWKVEFFFLTKKLVWFPAFMSIWFVVLYGSRWHCCFFNCPYKEGTTSLNSLQRTFWVPRGSQGNERWILHCKGLWGKTEVCSVLTASLQRINVWFQSQPIHSKSELVIHGNHDWRAQSHASTTSVDSHRLPPSLLSRPLLFLTRDIFKMTWESPSVWKPSESESFKLANPKPVYPPHQLHSLETKIEDIAYAFPPHSAPLPS